MNNYLDSINRANSAMTRLNCVVELLSGFSDRLDLNAADLSLLLAGISADLKDGLRDMTEDLRRPKAV